MEFIQNGALKYEIKRFDDEGSCTILYCRSLLSRLNAKKA